MCALFSSSKKCCVTLYVLLQLVTHHSVVVWNAVVPLASFSESPLLLGVTRGEGCSHGESCQASSTLFAVPVWTDSASLIKEERVLSHLLTALVISSLLYLNPAHPNSHPYLLESEHSCSRGEEGDISYIFICSKTVFWYYSMKSEICLLRWRLGNGFFMVFCL